MPSYDSKCQDCSEIVSETRSMSDYNKYPTCPHCGGPTINVILRAPMGFMKNKFEAFKSYVDGSIITNGKELKEHNLRNGVQNLHEGYDEAKILSGDLGHKKVEPTKQETLRDAEEAYHEVKNGYKPNIQECPDDE